MFLDTLTLLLFSKWEWEWEWELWNKIVCSHSNTNLCQFSSYFVLFCFVWRPPDSSVKWRKKGKLMEQSLFRPICSFSLGFHLRSGEFFFGLQVNFTECPFVVQMFYYNFSDCVCFGLYGLCVQFLSIITSLCWIWAFLGTIFVINYIY